MDKDDDLRVQQMASGEAISVARRTPAHCLYCADPAISWEHAIPEAIGGRLGANILCSRHNEYVNEVADNRLNENFAPLVNMLQVRRQRGTTGAEFQAKDDQGNPVIILAEGFAKQKRLDVRRRDDKGRIAYAEGDLEFIEALPKTALSSVGSNYVLARITNPSARFEIGMDESYTGAILKIALHFFASFVSDVSLEVANDLLKSISGETAMDGSIVRTPFLHDDVFPDSWPARHEVTSYPDGDQTLVTVLLFSAYAFSVRLPIVMPDTLAVRYTQVLSEAFPRFLTGLERPKSLEWNDRPSKYDAAAYHAPIIKRLERIHDHGTEQAIRAKCKRAYQSAITMSSNYGDLWARYTMQLQLECFAAAEVEQIIGIGKRLASEGQNAWEIPVVNQLGLSSSERV